MTGIYKRIPNARTALELLYRQLAVIAGDFADGISVSAPTAYNLLKNMKKLGILTETTGQMRDRVYVFQPYLALFINYRTYALTESHE